MQGAEDGCWKTGELGSPFTFPSLLRVQSTLGLHANPLFETLQSTKETLELSGSQSLDQQKGVFVSKFDALRFNMVILHGGVLTLLASGCRFWVTRKATGY